MTPTGLVRVAVEAGVATLTLDDPNRRNTISNALNAAVIQAVDACEADPEVRALVVTGAGMNMALACDLILAGRKARFDTRFLQIGLHPGGGHTWRLRRITDQQTVMAMVLFGEVLDGERAAEVGLAWRCVDDSELVAVAQKIAQRAARAPRELLTRTKATVSELGRITTSDEAVTHELYPQRWSMGQPAFAELLSSLQQQITKKD
jgi:enoyl-CoA hydratase